MLDVLGWPSPFYSHFLFLIWFVFIFFVAFFFFFAFTGATIECVEDFMNIDIPLPSNNIETSDVYLDGMKGYPNPRCQSTINDQVASFRLPLKDFYECGVTRIVHKSNVSDIQFKINFFSIFINFFFSFVFFCLTSGRIDHILQGDKVFKHKIIIEQPLSLQTVTVECTIFAPNKVIRYAGHNITRRDTGLPLGFEEIT